ncbi:hypothetical protein LVY72_01385 [Arthrobacter sp. I2-34]|uniref:Tetratricopeptide repeat protein n=1 Tax=Arthrobacter hankyongi TaxID=2904801 RepID=A0ABS9L1N8_9MICC|nr:hypothetical protein [Arthrobacter hankyongi]MCG2620559.1 hypothetical protein [Arthrobacter hankyongi]
MAAQQQSGTDILLELRAREAFMRRRYDQALALAREAADLASAREDTAAWWQMTFLQGECLREQGLCEECGTVANELYNHPFTATSPALTARVLTMLSVVSQILGALPKAIELAREALRLSDLVEQSSGLRIEAQLALIAALTESEQLEQAWCECVVLVALLDGGDDSQTAGKAYWVVGNVAFLRKDTDEGVKYHRLAAEHLSPTNDLALWAWFNRASATVRLSSELVDEETYECIQRAELATSIAGANDRDRLLMDFIKGHWHYLNGDLPEAVDILARVCSRATDLPTHMAGDALMLLGKGLLARGDSVGALEYLQQSEEFFRQAEAADRAVQVAGMISEMQASQ